MKIPMTTYSSITTDRTDIPMSKHTTIITKPLPSYSAKTKQHSFRDGREFHSPLSQDVMVWLAAFVHIVLASASLLDPGPSFAVAFGFGPHCLVHLALSPQGNNRTLKHLPCQVRAELKSRSPLYHVRLFSTFSFPSITSITTTRSTMNLSWEAIFPFS